MSSSEMILLLQRNEKTAQRLAFEKYYPVFETISHRYAKNTEQAEALLYNGFLHCLAKIKGQSEHIDLDAFFQKEFIRHCITYIKNIRSEYYVASTVHVNDSPALSYSLFDNNEPVDYKSIKRDIILQALQKLVPSQRLIFNLSVIDGCSLPVAAEMMESSVDAARSNLEKARFNFQRNVEGCVRTERA